MLLPPTPLTEPEVAPLEACSLRGPHPRQRRRALAILGHHRGHTLPQLAALFAVRDGRVHDWLPAWQQAGVAGLGEGRRAGRPPKLAAPAQKKQKPGSERPRSNCAPCCRASTGNGA